MRTDRIATENIVCECVYFRSLGGGGSTRGLWLHTRREDNPGPHLRDSPCQSGKSWVEQMGPKLCPGGQLTASAEGKANRVAGPPCASFSFRQKQVNKVQVLKL